LDSDSVHKPMVLRHMIYPHDFRPSFLSAIFVLRSTCASIFWGGRGVSSILLIPYVARVDQSDTVYTAKYSVFEETD